jgi:hypothetical protein
LKSTLARLLRSLASWIDGGESDAELRARALNLFRRPMRGTPMDLETVILMNTPCGREPKFSWSDDGSVLTVRFL